MGWVASLFVGVLTGLLTMVLAFFAASLAADWHNVSAFEGEAGYFVILFALLGLVAGFVLGVVTSRVVARRARPGVLKALGLSSAISSGIVFIIGTVTRFQADIPPQLDGDTLLLAAEIRWPRGQEPPPMPADHEWSLRLGSSSGGVMRASSEGPLWRQDARIEDGRWIVPGAVDIFTSRGERVLDILPQGTIDRGFIVPLPGYPSAEHREWSDWFPRARDGEPALPDGVRYRFRVVSRREPIRTETFGPFEIATIASGFHDSETQSAAVYWAASGRFAIRHKGQPVRVDGSDHVDAVAAVGHGTPALLVGVQAEDQSSACYLAVSNQEHLRIERVGECSGGLHPAPLTSDNRVFAAARAAATPSGRFDRTSFAAAERYLFPGVVVDAATMTTMPFSTVGQPELIARIPPVGASPDGASFVRLEYGDTNNEVHRLAVTTPGGGERYRVAIDKSRMRYASIDQIDPAWVLHHFVWDQAKGGPFRLVERPSFEPLAWRGTLTLDSSGYREYRVAPARKELRRALIDFLMTAFEAERLPAQEDSYSHDVRIGGATVNVSFSDSDGHVGVWMDRGTDSTLVAAIAKRFDEALATGRYDHLFQTSK